MHQASVELTEQSQRCVATHCTQCRHERLTRLTNAVVTWEIKLFWNNPGKLSRCFISHLTTVGGYVWNKLRNNCKFISSELYFARNHVRNWNKIISAGVVVLTLLQNYFGNNDRVGKYSWAATSPWNRFKTISSKIISDGRRWRLK